MFGGTACVPLQMITDYTPYLAHFELHTWNALSILMI